MRNKFTVLLLVLFLSFRLSAQYYVSNNGNDLNPGTISAPFKTIQKAANVMIAGDTCFIRNGIYRETVIPANNGTSTAHIVFKNYMNEKVIIVGTDTVSGWTSYQNGIYKAYVPDTVLQLCVDKRMANEARYPNFRGNYMSLSDWKSVVIDTNSNATFSGMNFPSGYWTGGIVQTLVASKWVAEDGKIISSNGSVVSCSETSYPWGSHPAYSPTVYTGSGYGYIIKHLNALDTVNEWHWQNDTLYYYPQNPALINTMKFEARKRMYGFNCFGKQYIDISNIHFVWATVSFETATGCLLINANVLYPTPLYFFKTSWGRQARDAANYGISQWDGKGIAVSGYNNTVKNTYVAHSWGDGISIGGQYNTVENCLVEDCDWTATDCGLITTVGLGHHIKNNTIRRTGRSALVHRLTNFIDITYNDMYDCGKMTQDLGVTYTYQSNGSGSYISNNWAHDNHSTTSCMGIYLDNADTNYVLHHNVVWNCTTGIQTNKPAVNHQIYNNTVWFCTNAMGAWGNTGTTIQNQIVKNNLSDKAWSLGTTFSNNLQTSNPLFTNAAAYDFTLASGSQAIDYGVNIPGFTNGYIGAAPDAGAYEYGLTPWVAGTNTMMPDISEVYTDPAIPDDAKIISGNFVVCQGQSAVIYTVEPVINATSYLWTLPNGATGTTSANTISVNFNNTASSGNITVKGVNSNGSSISTATRYITVNPFPAAAGSINGTDTVCFGLSAATYLVSPVANATSYIWTLPSGTTGTSSTNSINVNFGSTASTGNITVTPYNACGNGASSTLTVIVGSFLPDSAVSIAGLTTVCQGDIVTYTTPMIPNADTYIWTLPNGAAGISSTNSINVSYSYTATSGNVTVKGSNNCGMGMQKTIAVNVFAAPSAPQITITGDSLTSNALIGNQWYNLSTGIIPGAEGQSYTPLQSGFYFDIVNLTGCPSDSSNIINFNYTGVNELKENLKIELIPNPNSGSFEVICNEKIQKIEISDMKGQNILKHEYKNLFIIPLHLNLNNGVYLLKATTQKGITVLKVIINN
ncbi:MAG: T9SS type A sorting domain-containing protein [Bacteroidetes bacterium]|nr:T9SS type A sorting domain-containing protein [Bacteroidota bacterium]